MANVVVNRSDRYPVGTSVGAYPESARQFGSKPSGSATETQTVASDGSLTFTTLAAEGEYQLYAEVAGAHRYVRLANDSYTEPGTLQERLAARAVAINA